MRRVDDDRALAEWLALKGWCLFWLDQRAEAEEVIKNAREYATATNSVNAQLRTALVLGYLSDVRGAHAAALAWYTTALGHAAHAKRPSVLLEMGTSLSKQGRMADAAQRFDEALGLLELESPSNERLRAHILSRSAVVLENLGDLDGALRRQTKAVADSANVQDKQLQFECLCRRSRTWLALGRTDRAGADLAAAEPLAADARRGPLHLAHDWARLHRASRRWTESLVRYRECIRLLPRAEEIIATFSDIWAEILDGLEQVLARLGEGGVDEIASARADLRDLRDRSDIYLGQPLVREERRQRAEASTERVRRRLLESTGFFAAGFYFDLTTGTATSTDEAAEPVVLDESAKLLLACLHSAPGHAASVRGIQQFFKAQNRAAPTADALRQSVSRLRASLRLPTNRLLRGNRGKRGGGYVLETGS